jgi:endonuclease YncB( thermonuclease family)
MVDLGFNVMTEIKVRLLGWNCPELKEPAGKRARDEVFKILGGAKTIILETEKDAQTFNRWLARVYVDGQDLGQMLADKNHASPRREHTVIQ